MSKNQNLKHTFSTGIFWSTIDKFSVQFFQFLIGIFLARILLPKDFGLIGMLAIFIAVSQTFVDSGLGSGLIQKQNRTEVDYSTVFIFNFAISTTVYVLLFFIAPYIALFYKTPELTLITRIIAINLIINSLALVQRTRLTIDLNFKALAKINLISVLLSGLIAIIAAYSNYGVWALVIKVLANTSITVILLWFFSKWSPSLIFSKKSFKNLFSYSSKLLFASLYATGMQNIYNVMIGRVYTATSLGYYTQSKSLTDIMSGTITSALTQVTFPLLSSIQNDKKKMISIFRRIIKITAFFVIPVMCFLALTAKPIVLLLLGEKWIEVVPILQLMCFARIFHPLSSVNINFLNANGRSDLFLKVDLIQAPIIILLLIITIPISIKAIVIGHIISTIIGYFFFTYHIGTLFNYGAIKQLKDILSIVLVTLITSIVTFFSLQLFDSNFLKLITAAFSMVFTYLLFSTIFKVKELEELKLILLKFKK